MIAKIKTIIFVNLRFSDFYSKNLFKKVKEDKNIRLVAILDDQFKDKISENLHPYLDRIYELKSIPKMGFLGEFDYIDLLEIVEDELKVSDDISIVCSDEFNLLNAGRLRSEFGLMGHQDDYLLIFRDKLKMKQQLARAKIRVPKFKSYDRKLCMAVN